MLYHLDMTRGDYLTDIMGPNPFASLSCHADDHKIILQIINHTYKTAYYTSLNEIVEIMARHAHESPASIVTAIATWLTNEITRPRDLE